MVKGPQKTILPNFWSCMILCPIQHAMTANRNNHGHIPYVHFCKNDLFPMCHLPIQCLLVKVLALAQKVYKLPKMSFNHNIYTSANLLASQVESKVKSKLI